jgi:hypothetical protein
MQVEQRRKEETKTDSSEPNLFTYMWAIGENPARSVLPRQMKAIRILILEEYLQSAFINSNEIKHTCKQILTVEGSKLKNNSRFLPTMDSTTRRFLVNLKGKSITKKSSGKYIRGPTDCY